MQPLHTFGDCNQYGFSVTDAPQLVIMQWEIFAKKTEKDGSPKGHWTKCGLIAEVQEEIGRNGGVDATIHMLFAIRKSQTPGEPYRTSTQKMEDERQKNIRLEKARAAKAKVDQAKKAKKQEEKDEKIRNVNAKKLAKAEGKRKLRNKKAIENQNKEIEELEAEEKAKKKTKKKAK